MNLRDLFGSGKQRQIEKDLVAALRRARGIGRGLEVPLDVSPIPDPRNVALVASLKRLVQRDPELTLLQHGNALTLFYKEDIDPTLSPETKALIKKSKLLFER